MGTEGKCSLLSLKVQAGVLRGAAVVVDELLAKLVLDADKVGLEVGGRQAVGQLLDGGREAVVGLVARGPKGVAAGIGGRLDDLEDGVVGRDALKGNADILASDPRSFYCYTGDKTPGEEKTYSACHPRLASRLDEAENCSL